MQGSGACWPGAQRLGAGAKTGTRNGTVKLHFRKPSNAPQGERIGGYGSSLGF